MQAGEETEDAPSEAELEARLGMSEKARVARRTVIDKFSSMIDRDPNKAVAAIRGLLRGS